MTHTPNHHSLSIIENTSYLNESSIPHHHAFDPPPPRIVSTAGCCPDYPAVAPQVHINLTTLISLNTLLVIANCYHFQNLNKHMFKCTVNRTFDRANPEYGNICQQFFGGVHRTLFWSD